MKVPVSSRSIALSLFAAALMLVAGTAKASIMPPPMRPPPPPAQERGFTCDTEIDAPTSVKAAFQEYYECLDPKMEPWFEAHPEAVEALGVLHDRWRDARRHDLRERPEAGAWIRRHAVDFSIADVELTRAQLRSLAPTIQGGPVHLPGVLQRLFVDRANDRLFLTTDEEGLVSVDISKRYAFSLEGRVGTAGATDFFIVDATTAFVEETVREGGNGDLVVLDISDRDQPREVGRLRGVIPSAGGESTFRTSMTKAPPTFDEYLLYREGRLAGAECGSPPTVSTHPGIHCRPDGSCYRRETLPEPNEGVCQRITPAQRRVALGGIRRMPDGTWEGHLARGRMGAIGTGDGPRVLEASPPPRSSARPREAQPAAAPTPEGGAGGAGSLSQMMMYGNTLYVLSADHGRARGWLTTFDVTRPRRPSLAHVIELDNGPEALQRHDTLLLIAGRDALVTASLDLSSAPRLLGEYRQDCPVTFDPVVVRGSIAYRTIIVEQRTNACSSRLEVIELSQPHQPVLRTTRALTRPRGLAVLGERLFVADEANGVHVFDLEDGVNPRHAGLLELQKVKDLVISGFDLFALTPSDVKTFWVGPLFESGVAAKQAMKRVEGFTTVARKDDARVPEIEEARHEPTPSERRRFTRSR